MRFSRSRRSALLAATAVAVGGIAGAARLPDLGADHPEAGPEPAPGTPCTHAGQLRISSSTEKGMTGLADLYNERTRTFTVDGRAYCGTVTVDLKSSGAAERELEAALKKPGFATDESLPEVWLPSARAWFELLAHGLPPDRQPRIPRTGWSLARSPLVLALPEGKATALRTRINNRFDWATLEQLVGPDNAPLTWGDAGLLAGGRREWGTFRLRKDNAMLSTSGLAAAVSCYLALHANHRNWTTGSPGMKQRFNKLEGLVSPAGYSSDSWAMMTALATRDQIEPGWGDTDSAVIVQESLVYQYNTSQLGVTAAPREHLMPFYPERALFMDHPYVELPTLRDRVRQALSDDFRTFLHSPEAQRHFTRYGMRLSPDGTRTGELDALSRRLKQRDGMSAVDPVQSRVAELPWPGGAELEKIQGLWQSTRKRAHLMILVDESGAMSADHLERVRSTLGAALKQWTNDRDRVAVCGFHADPERQQAPVIRWITDGWLAGSSPALIAAAQELSARPGTTSPLRRAIREAQDGVARIADEDGETPEDTDGDGRWINVVLVVTAGNDPDEDTPRAAEPSPLAGVPVHSLALHPGAGQAAAVLKGFAERTRGSFSEVTDLQDLDRLFAAAMRVA